MNITKKILITLSLFLIFVVGVFATAYPKHDNYITDKADVINKQTESRLNTRLKDFEKKTSYEVAVLTISNLEGQNIRDYGVAIANDWGVGKKGKDNGVLMVVAIKDREIGIEVGRGAEGQLTDLQTHNIITKNIIPEFKKNDYSTGVEKGVDSILKTLSNDSAELASGSAQTKELTGWDIAVIIILIIIILFILAISPLTPLGGAGTWGVTSGWSSGDNDSGGSSFGGGSFSGGGSSSSW